MNKYNILNEELTQTIMELRCDISRLEKNHKDDIIRYDNKNKELNDYKVDKENKINEINKENNRLKLELNNERNSYENKTSNLESNIDNISTCMYSLKEELNSINNELNIKNKEYEYILCNYIRLWNSINRIMNT